MVVTAWGYEGRVYSFINLIAFMMYIVEVQFIGRKLVQIIFVDIGIHFDPVDFWYALWSEDNQFQI